VIRKRYTSICREGWYYLFVLVFVISGGLLRDINLLMVVAGMMLGPLLYNWRSVVVSLRELSIERNLPEGICAGDTLSVSLRLENHRRRRDSWSLVVEDQIVQEAGASDERATATVLFAHLPAGASQRQTYHGRLMHRGRYRFDSLQVSTAFPIGLVRRTTKFAADDTFYVFPRLGRLTRRWSQMRAEATIGARRAGARQGAMEGDFLALRDWRPGDSRRWIHWRTTARRGNVVVRQFEQQRNEDLVLLVDLWQPDEPDETQRERIEAAVSFAATAIEDLCRRGGSQLVLGVTAREPFSLHGQGSMGLLSEAMQQLAVVQAGGEDRLAEQCSEALEHAGSGATIAIISTRPVDLSDQARFGRLTEFAVGELAARKVLLLDVGGDALAEYFTME
jgi:uncharacterized protein (DUF58 family)